MVFFIADNLEVNLGLYACLIQGSVAVLCGGLPASSRSVNTDTSERGRFDIFNYCLHNFIASPLEISRMPIDSAQNTKGSTLLVLALVEGLVHVAWITFTKN